MPLHATKAKSRIVTGKNARGGVEQVGLRLYLNRFLRGQESLGTVDNRGLAVKASYEYRARSYGIESAA